MRKIQVIGTLLWVAMSTVVCFAQNPKADKSKIKVWDTSPFSYSIIDDLPPRYRGHSYSAILKALYDQREYLNKDEFESTTEHSARLERLRDKPLLGKTRFGSRIAFNFFPHPKGFEATYNADSQELNIRINWSWEYFNPAGSFYSLVWDDTQKTLGSYVAKNAFNAKVKVKVSKNETYYVVSGEAVSSLFPPPPQGPAASSSSAWAKWGFQRFGPHDANTGS